MILPTFRKTLIASICIACSNGQRPPADLPTPATAALDTPAAAAVPTSASQAGAFGTGSTTSQSAAGAANAEATTPALNAPSPPADATSSNVEPAPPLRDSAGKPLPQTEELPSFESPSFQRRIELLFQAIVRDEPQLATPAFFPLVAYEQVKDIAQPTRDHKFRLLAAFAKNIHEYHRQLGKNPKDARLVGISPSTLAPRWMKPGTEGNKLGYFRLLRSRLRIADARGQTHEFEVTSMISWRGQWYVVHLNGFK